MIDGVHEVLPLANYSPASRASVISLGTEDDLEAMAALMAPAFTDLAFPQPPSHIPTFANLSLHDHHNPYHAVDPSPASSSSSSSTFESVWKHAEEGDDNDDQVSLIYDDYAREPATPRTIIQGATPPISPSVFSHADIIDPYDENNCSSTSTSLEAQQRIAFIQTTSPHNPHSTMLSPPTCSPRRMGSQPSMRSMNSYYSSVSASSSGSGSSSSSSSILPSSHGANASSSSLSSLTRASYSPPASPCVVETPVDTTFAGAQQHVHVPGALSIIREADTASLVEVDGIVDYPFEEPYDLEALPSAYAPSFPYYSSAPPTTPHGTGHPDAAAAAAAPPLASSTGKSSRSKSHAQQIGLRLQASGVVSSVPPSIPPYHHPVAGTTPQRSRSYPVPTAAGMTMTAAAHGQVPPSSPPAIQVHRTRTEMESLIPPVPQTAPPQTMEMPVALSLSSSSSSPAMHAHALPAAMERRPSQPSDAVLLNRNPSMTSLAATTSATAATAIGMTTATTTAETASITSSSSGSSRSRQSRGSYMTMRPSPLSTSDLSSSPATTTPISASPATTTTTTSSTKKGLSFSRLMGSRSSVSSSEKTSSSSSSSALKHKSFTSGLSIKTGRPSSSGSVSSSSDHSGGPSSAPVDRAPTPTSSSRNLDPLDAKARKAELKRAKKAEMERLAMELAAKQRQRKADSDRTSVHSGKSGERKRRQWEDQKAMYDGLGTVVL